MTIEIRDRYMRLLILDEMLHKRTFPVKISTKYDRVFDPYLKQMDEDNWVAPNESYEFYVLTEIGELIVWKFEKMFNEIYDYFNIFKQVELLKDDVRFLKSSTSLVHDFRFAVMEYKVKANNSEIETALKGASLVESEALTMQLIDINELFVHIIFFDYWNDFKFDSLFDSVNAKKALENVTNFFMQDVMSDMKRIVKLNSDVFIERLIELANETIIDDLLNIENNSSGLNVNYQYISSNIQCIEYEESYPYLYDEYYDINYLSRIWRTSLQ